MLKGLFSGFVIVFVSLALMGCEVDHCADGNCEEVTAQFGKKHECALGFEGESCHVRTIEKFLGKYSGGKGGCKACRKDELELAIHEIPHDLLHLSIKDNVLSEPFVAKVNGWQFEISPQKNVFVDSNSGKRYEIEISGKGWIDLEQNRISYKFDNHGCEYSFDYQKHKSKQNDQL